MLMYTSCGWFFDELSGVETVQVIEYAGRVVQLSQKLFDKDVEPDFLERMEKARSNIAEHSDGRRIYEKWVKPSAVDLAKVGAHYAVSLLFQPYPDEARVYSYRVMREEYVARRTGRARLGMGRARVTSEITRETADLCFGVLHFGDQNLTGGVRVAQRKNACKGLAEGIDEPFDRSDLPAVIRLLDQHFGELTFSLRSLFKNEQREIASLILQPAVKDAQALYRGVYETRAPLMRFLAELNVPIPEGFKAAAQVTLNASLKQALAHEDLAPVQVLALLDEAQRTGVTLDAAGLGFTLGRTLERLAEQFCDAPHELQALKQLELAADLARSMPFGVGTWRSQNIFWNTLQTTYSVFQGKADAGDQEAQTWLEMFESVGEKLGVSVNGR